VDMTTTQFEYIHQPIYKIEHEKSLKPNEVESFFRLGQYFANRSHVKGTYVYKNSNPASWWSKIVSNVSSCDKNILVLDNCWPYTYIVNVKLYSRRSFAIKWMQKMFHSTVHTYSLERNRYNVVVHIRKGDGFKSNDDQVLKTIHVLNQTIVETKHVMPLFWIECEFSDAPIVSNLLTQFPNQTRKPHGTTLDAFQRLTQADAIIAAYSSFSFSGYLLNNRTEKGVMDVIREPSPNDFRYTWLTNKSEHEYLLNEHRKLSDNAKKFLTKDNLFIVNDDLYLMAYH